MYKFCLYSLSFAVGLCLFVLWPAFFIPCGPFFPSCYVHGPAMRLDPPFWRALSVAWGCDAPAPHGCGINPQTIHFSLRSRGAALSRYVGLRSGRNRGDISVPARRGYASLYYMRLHHQAVAWAWGYGMGMGCCIPLDIPTMVLEQRPCTSLDEPANCRGVTTATGVGWFAKAQSC